MNSVHSFGLFPRAPRFLPQRIAGSGYEIGNEEIGLGLRLKVGRSFGGVIWEGIRVGVGDWDGVRCWGEGELARFWEGGE